MAVAQLNGQKCTPMESSAFVSYTVESGTNSGGTNGQTATGTTGTSASQQSNAVVVSPRDISARKEQSNSNICQSFYFAGRALPFLAVLI